MYIVENILVLYAMIFGPALLLLSIWYFVKLYIKSFFGWTNNYVLVFQRPLNYEAILTLLDHISRLILSNVPHHRCLKLYIYIFFYLHCTEFLSVNDKHCTTH